MPPLTMQRSERTVEIRTRPVPDAGRPQLIWRARFAIVGVSVVLAAATYVISALLPGTYSASSDVLVSSTSAQTSVDAVNGANDLATQYAQFARTAVVMNDAAGRAGISSSKLTADTTAATVANTNIVRITVKSGSSAEAGRGALAVSDALVAQTQKMLSPAARTNQVQLDNLDKLLSQTKSDVTKLSNALADAAPGSSRAQSINTQLNNAQQQVTALALKRIDLLGQDTRSTTGIGVQLSGLTPQPTAAKVAPRPTLYALVALIAGLVLTTELAVMSGRRKTAPSFGSGSPIR